MLAARDSEPDPESARDEDGEAKVLSFPGFPFSE
jgi:hypothetical protein